MTERGVDDLFDLSKRVALITGGAGLLGREHAAALATRGAVAVIADINGDAAYRAVASLIEAYPAARCEAVHMDVTDLRSIRAVRDELVERHGRIDILINNAAIDPKVETVPEGSGVSEASRFEQFPLDEWNRELAVGLTGAFLCSQVSGAWMADHGGGVILNIASDLSVLAPDQRLYQKEGLLPSQQPVKPVTYSVIKTGLLGLTRYLATYWAEKNVRVNALSPGGVRAGQPDDFVRRLTNLIPLGRLAVPSEYWGVVQFLVSDASRYMTGQNIVMDGGRSVW